MGGFTGPKEWNQGSCHAKGDRKAGAEEERREEMQREKESELYRKELLGERNPQTLGWKIQGRGQDMLAMPCNR